MAVTQVAYLAPSSDRPGREDYPLEFAREVLHAAPGDFAITLLSCGLPGFEESLAPGLTRRVLPVERRPVHPLDGLSWQLLPALADADLVHLFHPETRLGEVGLLLARLRRIPVCVTRYGEPSSKLFAELELLDLAEHVFGLQASAAEAAAVYQRLTGDVRRAAA